MAHATIGTWADGGTTTEYTAALRAWMAQDPLMVKLSADSRYVGMPLDTSTLQRLENSKVFEPGTLEFQTECVFGSMAVHYSAGRHFRRTFHDPETRVLFMPVLFLPRSGSNGAVAPGSVSVALDEALGAASFVGGGGFTASLQTVHHFPAPVGETLLMTSRVVEVKLGSKGSMKYFLEGELTDVAGARVYSVCKGLFVRPKTNPLPTLRYELYQPPLLLRPEERQRTMRAVVAEGDPVQLRATAARRTAAIALLRTASGELLVNLPDFESTRRRWLEADPVVRLLGAAAAEAPDGAEHFEGKVLLAYGAAAEGRAVAAVRFCCTAEGPPSSAHGGGVIAVFEHATGRLGAGSRVTSTAVTYRIRVPLDETLVLEVALVSRPEADAKGFLSVRGELRSADGTRIFNTLDGSLDVGERSSRL